MNSCRGNVLIRFLFIPLSCLLIAGVGYPAVSELIKQEETTDAVNRYVLSVRYARTQAREQYRELSLCSSVDGNRCSHSNNWSTGWILIDPNTQEVQKSWVRLPGRLGFTADNASIHFGKNGFSLGARTVLSMFDKGCSANGGSEGRRVTVNVLGKTSVERSECTYLEQLAESEYPR